MTLTKTVIGIVQIHNIKTPEYPKITNNIL